MLTGQELYWCPRDQSFCSLQLSLKVQPNSLRVNAVIHIISRQGGELEIHVMISLYRLLNCGNKKK